MPCFGNAFYDVDGLAHERYGIPISKGAIIVARPDGTIGTICALEDGESLSRYFGRFVTAEKRLSRESQQRGEQETIPKIGEVDLEREEGAESEKRVVYETA